MARPPRIQQPGAWYHVIARGIERRALFSRDRDYVHFLELLGKLSERYACNISAYVLMPNHFHRSNRIACLFHWPRARASQ